MTPVLNRHSWLNVRKCVHCGNLRRVHESMYNALWSYDVLFYDVLFREKKLLISPAKLFNLGMINDFHIHLKFFPKGLYTDSIKKNIKNALSEESDIVASFSPLFSLSDPLCEHWLPLSRRRKTPGVGKGVECPEAFLAQKFNPSIQLSAQLSTLTFALHLCTKQVDYMLCYALKLSCGL